MKKLKKMNIMFILCFLIMIIAPLICANRISGKISSMENRHLASFPKILNKETGKLDKDFSTGFGVWLKDNIGFREFFMNLNNTINFKLFNEIANNTSVIGKDKWLFLMNDSVIAEVQNTNLIDKKQIEYYKSRYSEITEYFKNLGTDFIITVFPHKVTMYSEYLPDTILRINDKSLMDIMKNNFEDSNDFDLNIPLEELKKAKESKVIYSKSYDMSHWNSYGAFIGYTEVMKQAKKYIPNLKILTKDDFSITSYEKETYLWGSPFTKETDYEFKPKYPTKAVSDKSFFDKIGYNSKDQWKSYNYFKNSDTTLPKAIVVGDSYVWMFMLNNMAESFSELVFIHQLDIDKLSNIHNIIKPDIIIGAGLNTTMLGIASFEIPLVNPTAEIVSHNTPTEIKRGEKYNVDITVKNTTNEVWSNKKNIRLCIWQDGQDHGYRVNFPDNFELKPNEKYTFTLHDFQAPPSNKTYIEYQMLQEGITYFGEKERVDITVKN